MFQVVVVVGVDFFPLQCLHETFELASSYGFAGRLMLGITRLFSGPLRILPRRIVILDPSGAPGQVPGVGSRWLAAAPRSSVELPKLDPVPSPPLCERTHRGSPLDFTGHPGHVSRSDP